MSSPLVRLMPPLFVFLWATGFVGAGYAMPWAEPFTFLAIRFVLAATLLALIMAVTSTRLPSRRDAINAMLAGTLMHGIYLGCAFWAIHQGLPAGISALIVGLQPLLTALLAGLLLGERILPRHWVGLLIGFVGIVIVLSPGFDRVGSGITAATLAASLVSVLGMSVGTVFQKRFGGGTDLVAGTLFQYVGAAILMGLCSLALETRTVTFNGELIFSLVWLVLVLSIGAVFLLMLLIRRGQVSKVASLFYLVPAVTAVLAWPVLGEALSPVQVVGMIVTTAGVGLATGGGFQAIRARASR